MTDIGFNWHLTQYLKFYFDWQHAEYDQPIIYAPGKRQGTSDTFIARLQLYF
jgi:phosphate-selective porin OprO/OprP